MTATARTVSRKRSRVGGDLGRRATSTRGAGSVRVRAETGVISIRRYRYRPRKGSREPYSARARYNRPGRGVSPRDDAVTTIGRMPVRCRRPLGVGRDLRFTTRKPRSQVSFLLAASDASASFADIDVPIWAWGALLATIVAMLAVDLILHRAQHAPTTRRALLESSVWIAMGLTFAGVIALAFNGQAGGEYLAGYLIEKSLSVDNVFVWAVIFGTFAIPLRFQHRVLFWGVFGALILRAIFIVAG